MFKALHHQVVGAVAAEAANLQRRRHIDRAANAGKPRENRSQALRHLRGCERPRRAGRQLDVDPAGVHAVGVAATGIHHHRVDVGIAIQQVGDLLGDADHLVERRALVPRAG